MYHLQFEPSKPKPTLIYSHFHLALKSCFGKNLEFECLRSDVVRCLILLVNLHPIYGVILYCITYGYVQIPNKDRLDFQCSGIFPGHRIIRPKDTPDYPALPDYPPQVGAGLSGLGRLPK